ncbi:hypothetical protein BLA29_005006, partial [Euroglyphus maynei]
MDTDDVYKQALENIKQIEDEILFMLDQTNLDDDNDSKRRLANANLNSYCDILLDKVNKEIVWTNNFEQENGHFTDRHPTTTNNKNSIEQQVLSTFQFEPIEQQRSLNGIVSNDPILPNGDGDDGPINNNNKPDDNDDQITNDDKLSWISNKKHPFINGSSSRSSSTNSTNELDKESNYRYSFYDNCNKLAVYLAHSSILDELNINTTNEMPANDFVQIQLQNGGRILPDYIENALIYLSKCGLDSVGIFRKSGVKSRINMLKEKILQNEEINFDTTCESVYDVADLVKTWLRDLRPHLLTNDLIDMFTVAMKSKDPFHPWHLDDCHRYLLFVILKFLSMVATHSSQNQMNAQNLAICFAPSICEGDNEKQINRAQKCLQY